MCKYFNFAFLVFLSGFFPCLAQDTFSIVALDSAARQVGGAGASCLELTAAYTDDFILELFPDTGAIATQAAYLPNNQRRARERMRAGDSAGAIIKYLENNDGSMSQRQYGIVRFNGSGGEAKGYTGVNCIDYKNHLTGSIDGFYYSIQGNILLGAQVLTQMESNFRNTKGPLACRLMAAMQGAKIVGADTRCAANNTSSLFAFLKVTMPADLFGQPSLLVSMRGKELQQIEPIDSLQKLFDAAHSCSVLSVNAIGKDRSVLSVFPNPSVTGNYTVVKDNSAVEVEYVIYTIQGVAIKRGMLIKKESVISLPQPFKAGGVYLIHFRQDGKWMKAERLMVQ